jgi:hypothetical protein
MLPQLARGEPGTKRSILIDGIEFSVIPSEMEILPEPISDEIQMLDGGAREVQRRPHFDGVANHSDRYTFSIPYAALKGDDLQNIELVRVSGGLHRVTIWRLTPIRWTCKAGVQRIYLPRFRKCAAHLYAGLLLSGAVTVDTTIFPSFADLDGVEKVVTYAEGPTLIDPGAGGLVIAKQPDASGPAMDYTALLLGDVVTTGQVLTLWTSLTFETSMRAPRITLNGTREDHAHTFVEV